MGKGMNGFSKLASVILGGNKHKLTGKGAIVDQRRASLVYRTSRANGAVPRFPKYYCNTSNRSAFKDFTKARHNVQRKTGIH